MDRGRDRETGKDKEGRTDLYCLFPLQQYETHTKRVIEKKRVPIMRRGSTFEKNKWCPLTSLGEVNGIQEKGSKCFGFQKPS